MQKLTNIWEQYQPSINNSLNRVEEGSSAFITLVSNGNRDLKEYMGVLDKAQAALYSENGGTGSVQSSAVSSSGDTSASSNFSSPANSSADGSKSDSVSYTFKSTDGNTLAVSSAAGNASIVMTLANKNYTFPGTKSGAAKAYREALKSGDGEMIAQTDLMFKTFDSHFSGTMPNQKYVADTFSELQNNLTDTFDKEMVIAGSQKRKLYEPRSKTSSEIQKGFWNENVYFLDDSFVPSKYNESGQTIAQIKQTLLDKYKIEVGSIPFKNGVADFSGISVANIPTSDIVLKATNMTREDFALLSQKDRVALFEQVFSDAADGKKKREINFDYADQIAADRQISIPGLPNGYTSKELKKWREKNHFSWDEQVNGGYNLIPSVIHEAVSHTGTVGISRNANKYLTNLYDDIKNNPQKYMFDEENAPISISEILDAQN